MAPPDLPKGKKLESVEHPGTKHEQGAAPMVIKVHDCVLIRPDASSSSTEPFVRRAGRSCGRRRAARAAPPPAPSSAPRPPPPPPPPAAQIGEVTSIVQPDKGDVQLGVKWFYRPEEAVGGRKAFHGRHELFLSGHTDTCSVKTVISKARVLTLSKFQELSSVADTDFFARFTYNPGTKQFKPPRVPVFCVCEMPYNPDKVMVQCDACTEWYHPECLGKSRAELKDQANWSCPACAKKGSDGGGGDGGEDEKGAPDAKRQRQGSGSEGGGSDKAEEAEKD
ncbi:hypothetical protein HT031_002448 [Scenedesmus sp. PABB004]|nr:hypothetical protein HT031_002448 [Scenedesmus sp. PABB004]